MKTYRVTSTNIWSGDVEIVNYGLSKEQAERVARETYHEYNDYGYGGHCDYQICIEEEDEEEDG